MKGIFVRNEKKRACTTCDKKLVDGILILRVIGKDGKTKANVCSENCFAPFKAQNAIITTMKPQPQ